MTSIEAKQDGLKEDLQELHDGITQVRLAVLGNGQPEKSLLARVGKMEEQDRKRENTAGVWFDRLWKLAVSAALLIGGAMMAAG